MKKSTEIMEKMLFFYQEYLSSLDSVFNETPTNFLKFKVKYIYGANI